MFNAISSPTFDPAGYVEIPVTNDTKVGTLARRVNRIATLDGAATYNDAGYTDADRTIELVWNSNSKTIEDAVDRLIQLYSIVTLSTRRGVFRALLENYSPGASESTLRLLVLSKLSP
jgi:hypothetical protein